MKAENDAAIAQLASKGVPVFPIGGVPKMQDGPYAVVGTDPGTPNNYLLAGIHGTRTYRITVQCNGDTYNEAAWVAEKADAAFLDQPLEGVTDQNGQRELTPTIIRDPDGGGLMYGLATYTFLKEM